MLSQTGVIITLLFIWKSFKVQWNLDNSNRSGGKNKSENIYLYNPNTLFYNFIYLLHLQYMYVNILLSISKKLSIGYNKMKKLIVKVALFLEKIRYF